MRSTSLRALLTGLALVSLGSGSALVACSSSSPGGGGGGGGDAAAQDSSTPSEDAGDASIPTDATLPTDSGAPTSKDSGPSDATSDSHVSDAAIDSGFDFGVDAGCALGPSGEPTDLACTGLYSDWAAKTVSSDLMPYAPGLAFWSDGAEKQRWLYLPPGTKIDTTDMNEWTFPIGTRIWKEFSIKIGDAAADTRVETRLLWKLDAVNWYRTTYLWSADGTTSATELTTGELDAGGTGYEVPDQTRCNQCHHGRLDGVLGIEAVSLSATGTTGLTMANLISQGLITEPPDAAIVIPGDPVESAALAWLHSNCGTACHNRGTGQAENTGFWMRLDVATLATVQTTDTYTTGWGQQTIAYPIPGAATSYRLHACDLPESCVYVRASQRDGVNGAPSGTQMPPVDTHIVDTVDLAKVVAWINQGCDAGP